MALSSAVAFFFFICHSLLASSLVAQNDELMLREATTSVDLEKPFVEVFPSSLQSKCERVAVNGISRLKLGSYASTVSVTVAPSAAIQKRLHGRIQVCFHRSSSLGRCQCEKDDWRTRHNEIFSSVMSPYRTEYVDVKFTGDMPGSFTVSIKEEFQQWRLICLVFGLLLVLLAPTISRWVPFYYSSAVDTGVFIVLIFLDYQVSISLLVGIILGGAALRHWIIIDFAISEDGSVGDGVARCVTLTMRIVAAFSIWLELCAMLCAFLLLLKCGAVSG